MDSSVYHSDNTQLMWDLDSLFPYFQHSARKNKHTYHGMHTETNSDRKGPPSFCILGFKCGSMSLCEGEGGKVRYQCKSTVLSFFLFCFLLPSGWSDGA